MNDWFSSTRRCDIREFGDVIEVRYRGLGRDQGQADQDFQERLPHDGRWWLPSLAMWEVDPSLRPLLLGWAYEWFGVNGVSVAKGSRMPPYERDARTHGEVAQAPAASPRSGAWAVLHLAPGAPAEVVTAAFRALSKVHHPDVGGDAERFKAVMRAYEELRPR